MLRQLNKDLGQTIVMITAQTRKQPRISTAYVHMRDGVSSTACRKIDMASLGQILSRTFFVVLPNGHVGNTTSPLF